ncbi:MAG: septum formation initiator family protein [Deltaproteobacteria bacterium]|nr:MAG: septum formation initiator family protein [Deltaproteobacteria bacterium]
MARRQRNVLALQRWVIRGLLVGALLLAYAILVGDHGIRRYQKLRHALAVRSAEANERLARNRELLERLDRLRHDPRTLEELARTKLGVAGKNELVYVFPDKP